MKAVTVRQPYAWAVAIGAKQVENRSRPVRWRGEVAIHAGLVRHVSGDRDSRILQLLRTEQSDGQPTGVIVAVARLVDCHPAQVRAADGVVCCEPWGMCTYNDRPAWHLLLADVHRLSQPVPCKGALTIGWPVPTDVEVAVRSQLTPLEV